MDTTPVPVVPEKPHHTPAFYEHEFVHGLHMRIIALEEHIHPKAEPEVKPIPPAAPSDHEPTV